jgi:hypothetical protein
MAMGMMENEELTRWNIAVSKDTDLALRAYLGSQGAKKGDLSKFIEEAVRRHVFHSTARDIQARNADAEPEELEALIDEAVRRVREERRSGREQHAKARAAKA